MTQIADIFSLGDPAPVAKRTDDSPETEVARCSQLGVPIDNCDVDRALNRIDDFVRVGRLTGRCHQITTVNADFLVHALAHEDIHAILRKSDLSLADGMPIVWASRALGIELPGRVAGADLVPALAAHSTPKGYRILFFGGKPGSASNSAEILTRANPGLDVFALECQVGPRGETDAEQIELIRDLDVDIICVALGHPKQERWIRTHASGLGIPVAIGVGGTFDFIAETQKRAPEWIGSRGFEWLYRLVHEPRRLSSRYFSDFSIYLPAIARQIARSYDSRKTSRNVARVVSAGCEEGVWALSSGRVGRQTLEDLTATASRTRRAGRIPMLVLPTYAQTRGLERERLDRLFLFLPDNDPSAGPKTLDRYTNTDLGEFLE